MNRDSLSATPGTSGLRSQADLPLLRALAFGGKRSAEIRLLLDGETGEHADFQKLALVLTGLSVRPAPARETFEALLRHQAALQKTLNRPVKIKTAAVDLLESLEDQPGREAAAPDFTYDELVEMAFHDHLTGVNNYRNFSRRLPQELRHADRYRHLASLIMIDIDHFKKFNDRLGHECGNQALVHVASILKEQFRETDMLARYGGEEFAVLLPGTAKHETARLANLLCARVEARPVPLEDAGPQPLTVSMGVATYPCDARTPQALLEGADAALYQAKAAGRNKVQLYEPPSAITLRYQPAEPAQRVAVVGDFNGWDPLPHPLVREGEAWAITLHLAPGRYVYKFVVDGDRYLPDPQSVGDAHDGYGGMNSVLVVK